MNNDNKVTFRFESRSSGVYKTVIPEGLEEGSAEWDAWVDKIAWACETGEYDVDTDELSFNEWEFVGLD